ncbi:hypothetical protein E4K67_26910 [Desulfosporosinus fructosivorans]|uniref:Uncharacterized protein n=1 Tax=Desulfosporosinus fructosivorans TaxID=2018669 RepID=A0A4Z0QX88_9FIRM|nr:hypothetical protein [Desulfosporosinus fructosivorans]TGE35124.1 hypothetical protein E4K67_26910 [Desulfosporosinus fructosivorans]
MEFVAELKQFKVLQSNQIISFRNYIQRKYPTASIEQRSIILADSIDKVIDKYIQDFNKRIRDQVKVEVLRRAVITDNYNICGSDIFRACLFIKDTGENFNAALINWLNNKCCSPIEEKHIDLLLIKVANSYNEYFNYELEYIIDKSIFNQEDDCRINPTIVIETSYFRGFLVERFRANYDYLKGKIIRDYILYQVLVASLMLTAIFNSSQVVRQINSVTGINPQMIFAGLQYKEKNDEVVPTQENTHQQDNKEQLMYKLQYRQLDEKSLIQFLSRKGSILCEEPYYSSIIQASHEYDIDPLLLFAITGQEQSFVPKNAKNAKMIANNPFNVYGSWQAYNTNILDSSRIAANLVATLRKDRPLSIDPIVWINTKYAEDKTWHVGVRLLMEELNNEVIVERNSL